MNLRNSISASSSELVALLIGCGKREALKPSLVSVAGAAIGVKGLCVGMGTIRTAGRKTARSRASATAPRLCAEFVPLFAHLGREQIVDRSFEHD